LSRKSKALPTEEEFDGTITKVIKDLKSLFEEEEEDSGPISWYLNTGNLALNYIISQKLDGGYPGGKTVELFGEPSTGKTLLIDKAGAAMQKAGGIFVMHDAENRWDKNFAVTNGVDVENAIHLYPETVEDFTVWTYDILTNHPAKYLFALDSIAILTYEKEINDLIDGVMKADQGGKAKKLKYTARALRSELRKTGSILLVANHVMDQPNSPVSGKKTPGGRGTPYQSTVRILTGIVEPIQSKKKQRPLGARLSCSVTKNSIAPPFGTVQLDVYWKSGIHKYSGLLKVAEDLGMVTQTGGWYTWNNIKFRSYELEGVITNNPEFLTDPIWKEPYFMMGEEFKRAEDKEEMIEENGQ